MVIACPIAVDWTVPGQKWVLQAKTFIGRRSETGKSLLSAQPECTKTRGTAAWSFWKSDRSPSFRLSSALRVKHTIYYRLMQVFFLFFSKNFNINNFLPKFKLFTRHVTDLQPLRKKHQLIFLIDGFFAQHWYMSDILSQKFPSILTLYRPLTAKGSMRHQPIQRLCMPAEHRPQ